MPEPQAWKFIKRETLEQVFPVNFVKSLRATLFTKYLQTTASGSIIFFFGFSLSEKITDILKQSLGAVL